MLEFHPIANKFPMIGNIELKNLTDDLEKNGQKKAIALLDGMIWDGRARAIACERLGSKPRYRIIKR
jgi:hypothetical protein